jgi:hypothetical protein
VGGGGAEESDCSLSLVKKPSRFSPEPSPPPKEAGPAYSSIDDQPVGGGGSFIGSPLLGAFVEGGVVSINAFPDEHEGGSTVLEPCPQCGRSFAAARLAIHTQACTKKRKKRKKFNVSKMRTAGTEVRTYAPFFAVGFVWLAVIDRLLLCITSQKSLNLAA